MTVADFLDEAHVDLATMQQVLDTAQRALDVAERAERTGRRARSLLRRIVVVVAAGLVGAGAVYVVRSVLARRRATPTAWAPAGPGQNGSAAPDAGVADPVT